MTPGVLVFAYGSNLSSRRLRARTPSAQPLCGARLKGHALRLHKRGRDGSAKANAFATGDPDDVVYGVIYEIADDEMPALHVAETGYSRAALTVATDDGERTVLVYRAKPDWIDDTLAPQAWYVDHIVEGAREHGVPLDAAIGGSAA